MPGIVIFGRRWAVGSDDFVFPAATEILLRAAWYVVLASSYCVRFPTLADTGQVDQFDIHAQMVNIQSENLLT